MSQSRFLSGAAMGEAVESSRQTWHFLYQIIDYELRWHRLSDDARQDVRQLVAIQLFLRQEKLEGQSAACVRGYIHCVCAGVTARFLREKARYACLADNPTDHSPSLAMYTLSSEELYERVLDGWLITTCLKSIPDNERVVVELMEIEELTKAETARRLGMPEGTVASRLRRAKERLRMQVGAEGFTSLAG